MKNPGLLTGIAICCGFGLTQSASIAQPNRLETIVKPSLQSCAQASRGRLERSRVSAVRVIPAAARKEIATARIARTLNGIWRGDVVGDAGDVHVDYFWIIDMANNEALIIAQRSGRQTVRARSQFANPPKLSYLMCPHEGYTPGSNTPQIHTFTKISNSTAGAARLVQSATGVRSRKERPSLSDLWQGLVASKYFDRLPYVAFAGALFKPVRLDLARSGNGPAEVSLGWDAQYRGGGRTKLRYMTGVPMVGSERGQFVATRAPSGDYLVSSLGNGKIYKVEVFAGGNYDLSFDSVVLGPMQP